jgi:hypothetical protein
MLEQVLMLRQEQGLVPEHLIEGRAVKYNMNIDR